MQALTFVLLFFCFCVVGEIYYVKVSVQQLIFRSLYHFLGGERFIFRVV